MQQADEKFKEYTTGRSRTFRETVKKYREKHGRHPPPGFTEWYKYARKKGVFNIDDFEQVMDDLRPFWAIEPKVLRNLAAHASEDPKDGISGIHIRNGRVAQLTNPSWRSETLETLIEQFSSHLPDMDIAMNRLDQPRLTVPWEDMQSHLAKEMYTRGLPFDAQDQFTSNLEGLLDLGTYKEWKEGDEPIDKTGKEDPGWFGAPGRQYMELAALACPPGSPARDDKVTISAADAMYKDRLGGIVTNFNLSSDLCTVGPAVKEKHGFLYSASSVIASKRLIPVFGECKVNINSDILFPANMYWKHDERYDYNGKLDVAWEDKQDDMIWRGVTSGGVQLKENWSRMHRQRLALLANGTFMDGKEVEILTSSPHKKGEYTSYAHFNPAAFAKDHFDVGFTEAWGCIPNCDFYNDVWTYRPQMSMAEQFQNKYLIDVDGHSFSGRWRAFLQSKSLGIKATIFREWHDSRLFAWKHFVPLDNRYDDLYTLLTYFIGVGSAPTDPDAAKEAYGDVDVFVPNHDFEGKRIATQARDWASLTLRREDIEIYTFRLLLEYARILDDNRDMMGYAGDGSELESFDAKYEWPELPGPGSVASSSSRFGGKLTGWF